MKDGDTKSGPLGGVYIVEDGGGKEGIAWVWCTECHRSFTARLETGEGDSVVAHDAVPNVLVEDVKRRGFAIVPVPGRKGAYVRVSGMAAYRLFVVRSRMGTSGPNASELTVLDAIDELKPDYVVSYGIAFGRDSGKQRIGDVMVSEWIRLYEKQRVGEDKTIPRGERLPAASILLQRAAIARAGRDKEHGTVHTGGLMSGDKLVDQEDLKNAIFGIEPEAIGGDMEGGGIVSACERRRVGWLVVKGICDWGANKNDPSRDKTRDQRLAAERALQFTFDVIGDGRRMILLTD